MSLGLFVFGLLAWIAMDLPHVGCCLLALAWLFHNGPADGSGDDDGSGGEPIYDGSRNRMRGGVMPASQGGKS